MLASFLKRDLKNLNQRDASPNFQAQNGLLSLRSWWRSVRSLRCRCEKCGHDDVAHIEFKTIPQAIRDLNLWEQPCFWIYQAPFHRCARCNYRQHIIPPFKRKDVSYTYRFEQFVLRSLIGSTAEEVARRLGISAETV